MELLTSYFIPTNPHSVSFGPVIISDAEAILSFWRVLVRTRQRHYAVGFDAAVCAFSLRTHFGLFQFGFLHFGQTLGSWAFRGVQV